MLSSLPSLQSYGQNDVLHSSNGRHESSAIESSDVLPLVLKLCRALEREEILYCHWKSNNRLDLSATADNDLDILVSSTHALKFNELLSRLGFKQVKTPPEREVPAVLDYFGYDAQAGKFVHVHAHYQLTLGHDLTKNYRLPIEKAYLRSSIQGDLFRVPTPEFEFMVYVVRLILKHSTWDVMLFREGGLKKAERAELDYLLERVDMARVREMVTEHLPFISDKLFSRCLQALQPASSAWSRIRTGQRLQMALQANARRPLFTDTCRKLRGRVALALRRRVFKYTPKYGLQNRGVLIALVGGDGAGKSTAIDAIYKSLSKYFGVSRIHMGRPAWSPVTIAVRSFLKIGQLLRLYPLESSFRRTLTQASPVSPGYPFLVREVCTARDRRANYVKARRYAAEGGIVLLDRYPVSQVEFMDGPQCERFVNHLTARPRSGGLLQPSRGSGLTRYLVALEQRYYSHISPSDMLIVLRVEPEIAVQRKTDEDPSSVRERSTAMWQIDWEQTDAYLVDASKSREEVASEIAAFIWSQL